MSDIPLPRTRKAKRESDVPLPPRPVAGREQQARDDFGEQTPSPAVTEKPRPSAYGRGEVVFHLLLPAVALLFGLSLLLGLLYYVNHGARGNDEPLLSFVVGIVFTVLGGLELLVWWWRLRQLGEVIAPASR
jgi:hypothetical protein